MAKKSSLIIILLIVLSMTISLKTTGATGSATIQLVPQTSTVEGGTTFTVNLTVTNVTNLAVWEFRLFYLNTILNCTNAVEGPFLGTGGSPQYFTFNVTSAYNATDGCLLFGATLIGPVPGVNGSGTLATITFQALAAGNTSLHFDNNPTWNFLLDSSPPPRNPIPYTTVDGTVQVTPGVAVHDLAVTAMTPLKTIVGHTYPDEINVTTKNLGGYTEIFNLTLYVNATIIGTINNIVVESATAITNTFIWNTTSYANGNYTLSAYAWPVAGETDTSNNLLVGGWVVVTIPGDLNGDGTVNILDAIQLSNAFLSTPGTPNWNSNADINGDGVVNILDAILLSNDFGLNSS